MALIIFTKYVNLCNIVEYKNSLYRTYLQLWYMKNVDNDVNLLKLFPFSLLLIQYTYALISMQLLSTCSPQDLVLVALFRMLKCNAERLKYSEIKLLIINQTPPAR